MIEFDCPECGEEMEIPDRMAGKEVRCTGCDQWVDIPTSRPRRRRKKIQDDVTETPAKEHQIVAGAAEDAAGLSGRSARRRHVRESPGRPEAFHVVGSRESVVDSRRLQTTDSGLPTARLP